MKVIILCYFMKKEDCKYSNVDKHKSKAKNKKFSKNIVKIFEKLNKKNTHEYLTHTFCINLSKIY